MAKPLTTAAVKRFKAKEKRQEIPDGFLPGLYLIIQPSGAKSWTVRYRLHGKQCKLRLGTYPVLDLAEAREQAREALQIHQRGGDPAAARRQAELAVFDVAARSFLSEYAKPKNRSWKETARLLGYTPNSERLNDQDDPGAFMVVKNSLADKWKLRELATIERGDIRTQLKKIVDRGAPVVANRTFAALRSMLNWAVSEDLISANPCDGLKAPVPAAEKSRDRVLSDEELRLFCLACDDAGQPFGLLFKFLLLTGQRREEAAGMTWSEIDGDTWTIPRDRAKNDKAHAVPLSAPASAVLESARRIEGKGYAFTTTGQTPVSGYSRAKARIDQKMLEIMRSEASDRGEDPDGVEIPAWRLHDLRRTVASGMARLGIGLPVIERVLNHVSGSFGGIVGVYQHHEFHDEKRCALETWGRFIESLQSPQENIFALKRR